MAVQEQAPRPDRQEGKRPQDAAAIASHVAYVVENLKRDRQAIPNPHELCTRADMAMVAMFEMVAPVLPEIVKAQAERLISIHDEFYQSATPPAQQLTQDYEQGTAPRPGSSPIH